MATGASPTVRPLPESSGVDTPPTTTTSTTEAPTAPTPSSSGSIAPSLPPATYIATAGDPPPMALPSEVDGYRAEGALETGTTRVFVDSGSASAGIGALAGHCYSGFWAMRWRSQNEIPVVAGRQAGGGDSGTPVSDMTETAASGTSGYMTGYACATPSFAAVSVGGFSSEITDVIWELQRYVPTVDGPSRPVAVEVDLVSISEITFYDSGPVVCTPGNHRIDLPIARCDEGRLVGYLQDELGVARTEVFDKPTLQAVRSWQSANGVEPDGVVGYQTWRQLMAGVGLPGWDYDEDGVIMPDELGE